MFPTAVAIGDLDGDLDLDLAVANTLTDDVSVLLNNGDGTFGRDVTSYGAGYYPQSVAIGDLDGDGDLDLDVANAQSGNVSVLLNDCSTCPADLDDDGLVGLGDLSAVIEAWGDKGGPEDLDGSCTVDFPDILIVLDSWGPCE